MNGNAGGNAGRNRNYFDIPFYNFINNIFNFFFFNVSERASYVPKFQFRIL